ncbi:MAG: hypothetical protein COU35_04310 [Candidatus Magasanikbacteria bacterium CG10_big_fil_rev_8_21_14_0_10_47_10]|uniref:Segregation and condensation protein A n=1 Tax=Candidatus Magasanikbacteria bacterium CG10_big_fil_rev_8_21_14_0_10_47_10 TaxID=1974652 RepID=A0A2H0TRI4_9BACT|nr:MAG: hypothetical protein COU35_04310 [Candidatus Magasanikbacteria bacterium CG10_big_fil_rev_8_21_14_0_10_47_10]
MKVHLTQFDGPLDLLLSLLQEKKLAISEIAISEVTDQFLNYVEQLDEGDPEEMADFLVIATRLLLMKSRALLPLLMPDEDDGPSLEEQLRVYKAFVEVSKHVNTAWESGLHASFRHEPPRQAEGFSPPDNFVKGTLYESMVHLIKRLAPAKALPQIRIEKTVSVKERIQQLRALLASKKSFRLSDVLDKKNKSDLIVGFLALLELVKQRHVLLKQTSAFADITVTKQ